MEGIPAFNVIPFILGSIFYLIFLGLSLYMFVLFIKLANRGIKALDIYIEEKTSNRL